MSRNYKMHDYSFSEALRRAKRLLTKNKSIETVKERNLKLAEEAKKEKEAAKKKEAEKNKEAN